jgi:hypothetical protein
MKRTYHFASSLGTVTCSLPNGRSIEVPVFAGIMKHPTSQKLPDLLRKPSTLRKYTMLALSKASWPILRHFPRSWLQECLPEAPLAPSRRQALDYLLS